MTTTDQDPNPHSAPTADEKSKARRKFTVQLERPDALRMDELLVEMRRRTGRDVFKSDIVRELVRMAEVNVGLNRALGEALSRGVEAEGSETAGGDTSADAPAVLE